MHLIRIFFLIFYLIFCFHGISFSGCERNVYGATPAEILHAVLLGLCEYIANAMELIFTDGSFDLIS